MMRWPALLVVATGAEGCVSNAMARGWGDTDDFSGVDAVWETRDGALLICGSAAIGGERSTNSRTIFVAPGWRQRRPPAGEPQVVRLFLRPSTRFRFGPMRVVLVSDLPIRAESRFVVFEFRRERTSPWRVVAIR